MNFKSSLSYFILFFSFAFYISFIDSTSPLTNNNSNTSPFDSSFDFVLNVNILRKIVKDKVSWVNKLGKNKMIMIVNEKKFEEVDVNGDLIKVNIGQTLQLFNTDTAKTKLETLLSELDCVGGDLNKYNEVEKSVLLLSEWNEFDKVNLDTKHFKTANFYDFDIEKVTLKQEVAKLEKELLELKQEYDQFRSRLLSVDNSIDRVVEFLGGL